MQPIDTLISADWIIPVSAPGSLKNHAIAIQAGRILDILPLSIALHQYLPTNYYPLSGHTLIPGLINTHTHAAMNLFRGLADDLPLQEWLRGHIWPAESHWVKAEFVRVGTRLAIAEMLRGGTTCFSDMYFFPEETARVIAEIGVRACIGMIIVDFSTTWARNANEYIEKGRHLVFEAYRHHPLIQVTFAPHAPYTVQDETLVKVRDLSAQLELPIHMHVHETAVEIREHEQRHGCRPLTRLDRLGLLDSRLIAVHMTQLLPAEIEHLSRRGTKIVHCPQSNLKLASGFCPVADALQAGLNVSLGTDGAASNNDLDMWDEMRTAALLAKGVSGRADALPAAQALEMATLAGARALGMDENTGSLESGKAADIVAVDLECIETQPIYDPVSQLVYAAGREAVTHVWIEGQLQLRNRELTQIDLDALKAEVHTWKTRIAEYDHYAAGQI